MRYVQTTDGREFAVSRVVLAVPEGSDYALYGPPDPHDESGRFEKLGHATEDAWCAATEHLGVVPAPPGTRLVEIVNRNELRVGATVVAFKLGEYGSQPITAHGVQGRARHMLLFADGHVEHPFEDAVFASLDEARASFTE